MGIDIDGYALNVGGFQQVGGFTTGSRAGIEYPLARLRCQQLRPRVAPLRPAPRTSLRRSPAAAVHCGSAPGADRRRQLAG